MTRDLADEVLNRMLATPWFATFMASYAEEMGSKTASAVWNDFEPDWLHVAVNQQVVACLYMGTESLRGLFVPETPLPLN
jgi:hypothetical protein